MLLVDDPLVLIPTDSPMEMKHADSVWSLPNRTNESVWVQSRSPSRRSIESSIRISSQSGKRNLGRWIVVRRYNDQIIWVPENLEEIPIGIDSKVFVDLGSTKHAEKTLVNSIHD